MARLVPSERVQMLLGENCRLNPRLKDLSKERPVSPTTCQSEQTLIGKMGRQSDQLKSSSLNSSVVKIISLSNLKSIYQGERAFTLLLLEYNSYYSCKTKQNKKLSKKCMPGEIIQDVVLINQDGEKSSWIPNNIIFS